MIKRFTLIELIVVIAVLGILAAIVLPNISGMKEKSIRTAVIADTRVLQTVSDMYQIDNNSSLPTIAPSTEKLPQPVDFAKVYPEHLRNLPKTEGVKYWVDVNGTVWSSFEDMPQGFKYDATTGNLTWSKVPTARGYEVQEVVKSSSTSALGRSVVKYKPVQKILDVGTVTFKGDLNKTYAISSIDKYGFPSAPISTTAGYEKGYQDTLESIKKGQAGTNIPTSPTTPPLTEPTTPTLPNTPAAPLVSYLNVVVTPQTLDNNSKITTSVTSTDTTKLNIKLVEYRVDGGTATTTAPTGPFTMGTHTIEVRAQDQSGNWTDWVSKTIQVTEALAVLPSASFLGYYVEQPSETTELKPTVTMTAYSKGAKSVVVYRINKDLAGKRDGTSDVYRMTEEQRANYYYKVSTNEYNLKLENGLASYTTRDLSYNGDTNGESDPEYKFEFTMEDGTKKIADGFGIIRLPYEGYKTYAGYTQNLVPKAIISVFDVTSKTAKISVTNMRSDGLVSIEMIGKSVYKQTPYGMTYTNNVYGKTYTSSISNPNMTDTISLTDLLPNTLHKVTYRYEKNGVQFYRTEYFVTGP